MDKTTKDRIIEEIMKIKAEAEKALAEIPEEFESLEDSEDNNYYNGQYEAADRILKIVEEL